MLNKERTHSGADIRTKEQERKQSPRVDDKNKNSQCKPDNKNQQQKMQTVSKKYEDECADMTEDAWENP